MEECDKGVQRAMNIVKAKQIQKNKRKANIKYNVDDDSELEKIQELVSRLDGILTDENFINIISRNLELRKTIAELIKKYITLLA